MIDRILAEERQLTERYADLLSVNHDLDRRLVSFQGNRSETGYRWIKYKEGYSAALVHYVLDRLDVTSGPVLDPFAGSGTTLFACSDRGMPALGIELLPNCAEIICARDYVRRADGGKLARRLKRFADGRSWEREGRADEFPHLRMTRGAFPQEHERELCRYLVEARRVHDRPFGDLLVFAAMGVLETISYTRKDGQYLRWDYRSGRREGANTFNKGHIPSFTEAITTKLLQIAADLEGGSESLFADRPSLGHIDLVRGSCLSKMSCLPPQVFEALITSPPYCNRYDYTRTYALELAMLGIDEAEVRQLRQSLLSCTVENRPKSELPQWVDSGLYRKARSAVESQCLLQMVLAALKAAAARKELNNQGIPRMVQGYFEEMAIVIFQVARLLKPNAPFVMVNDNVRYHGLHLPVDLILSDFAVAAGFNVEAIWVLPRGKGNSSQQMGNHGRQELRKCVYVWRARAR